MKDSIPCKIEIECKDCPINDGDCTNCQYLDDIYTYTGMFSGRLRAEVYCKYEEPEEVEDEKGEGNGTEE